MASSAEEGTDQPSSSGGESTSSQGERLDDYFVRHKLSKHDTLAGLAVKYNVTVSDIKRANGLLADSAMFAKDTLLIPTRPLPVGWAPPPPPPPPGAGPEYSTWAGMIVTHYGRLGSAGDEAAPSESAEMHAAHFSQTRAMRQLRGYYSTGPSRTQSPQYGSDDSDRHHLFAGGWGSPSRRGAGPQQVELMERSASAAAATYIEDRLRRRGRGDSQQDDLPASSSQAAAAGEPGDGGSSGGGGSGAWGAGPAGDSGHFALLHHRPALFGSEGAALVSAGGRQLTQWKDSLLKKLKKVASQPALAPPAGASTSLQQLGQAAVASAPSAGGAAAGTESTIGRAAPERPSMRQRTSGSGGGPKAD